MKRLLACMFALILSSVAFAQESPSTSFILGAPYNNYLPVTRQDVVAFTPVWYEWYVYDCTLTTKVCYQELQQAVNISLPNDPTAPGSPLYLSCQGTLIADTVVWGKSATAPTPASAYVQSNETCQQSNNGATWKGVLIYNYNYFFQRHCSSGRGGTCVSGYYPVAIGGSGQVSLGTP